jgi:mono/diheme cytochrome c family protein
MKPWLALMVVSALCVACGSSAAPADAGLPGVDSGPLDAGVPDAGGSDAGTDTWTNWASPQFFQAYCVSCHSTGNEGDPSGSNLDFSLYEDVVQQALTIRCGVAVQQNAGWSCSVQPEQFPIGNGPKPSDADRERLIAWIDGGMPE